MTDSEHKQHLRHCCSKHGCKYSSDYMDCPVASGAAKQYGPCIFCFQEEEDNEKMAESKSSEEELKDKIAYFRQMRETIATWQNIRYVQSSEVNIYLEAARKSISDMLDYLYRRYGEMAIDRDK